MSDDIVPFKGYDKAALSVPLVDSLTDDELKELNSLLPWGAFVADSHGRRFGRAHNPAKRTNPTPIPDRRTTLLNEKVDLSDKVVLEVGCFEGLHTVGLCRLARKVKACDSRVVNVVKTAVRCAAFRVAPELFVWDVEKVVPVGQDASCDVLHHFGVLYHLLDPISHLRQIASLVSHSIYLDTHIASDQLATSSYAVNGKTYRCHDFREGGFSDPFSGMSAISRWLLLDDLSRELQEIGFANVELIQTRDERNGPRVLILAQRFSG